MILPVVINHIISDTATRSLRQAVHGKNDACQDNSQAGQRDRTGNDEAKGR